MRYKESSRTRTAVLDELNQLIEGRHPDCQTFTGRFLRDPKFQQASMLLYSAIKTEDRIRACELIAPPPSWLLP